MIIECDIGTTQEISHVTHSYTQYLLGIFGDKYAFQDIQDLVTDTYHYLTHTANLWDYKADWRRLLNNGSYYAAWRTFWMVGSWRPTTAGNPVGCDVDDWEQILLGDWENLDSWGLPR